MLDRSPSNVGTAGLTSLPGGRADSPSDPRTGSSQNAMGKGGDSKKSVFSLLGHPKPTPPCGPEPLNNRPHAEKTAENPTPMRAPDTPLIAGLSSDAAGQGGAKIQHGGVDNHPPASHGGVDNPIVKQHGGVEIDPQAPHGGSESGGKSDKGQEGVPEWLANLRGFYDRIIASVSRGKPRLEPADWERIWALYHAEVLKELGRRQAAQDLEGYRRCNELAKSIAASLVVALRQQAAELIKRQFKGEKIAMQHFPAGDPPPDKRALFEQWTVNFAQVTQALGAMADRITGLAPTYDLAQDWPSPDWFKAEEIPEGLWAS